MSSLFHLPHEGGNKLPHVKINLLDQQGDALLRQKTVRLVIGFTLFIGIFASVGAWASFRSATTGNGIIANVGALLSFSEFRHLWTTTNGSHDTDPLNTPDGRFNVLLLGIGGEGHDGSQLTDTILLAEYDNKNSRLALVSIPRDLAFPLGEGNYEKINAVNAYAEQQHPGEGSARTAEAIGTLLKLRIDRVIKVDFQGFEKLIDVLGGIDINVEHSFSDSSFPTDDNGPDPYKWTTVTFAKGVEHMDGHRALTYVRSRHGSNGEGSDFARSRRQQIVMNAVRERLLELGTLGNPRTMTNIWSTISDHVQTNLTPWDMLKLVPAAINFQPSNLTQRVFTDAPDGELTSGTIGGAFVLFPKKMDYTAIQSIVANPWETTSTTSTSLTATTMPLTPKIHVAIQNGTIRTGFAGTVADNLKQKGYIILSTGNAAKRGIQTTVVYDLTNGQKLNELIALKKLLHADISSAPLSALGTTVPTGTQFLIILGESSIDLQR